MALISFIFFSLIPISTAFEGQNYESSLHSRLGKRQLSSCLSLCNPLLPSSDCNSTSCVCSVVSALDVNTITFCLNCLNEASILHEAVLELLVDSCANCPSQCTGIISLFLQSFVSGPCDASCLCTAFMEISASEIATCSNCLQASIPVYQHSDSQIILQLEQDCSSMSLSQAATSTSAAMSQTVSALSKSSVSTTPESSPSTTKLASLAQPQFDDLRSWPWLYSASFILGIALVGAFM